jgi:hypothetical protein
MKSRNFYLVNYHNINLLEYLPTGFTWLWIKQLLGRVPLRTRAESGIEENLTLPVDNSVLVGG